jgi:hypothetical protein
MPDFILNPHATRAILSLIIAHQGTLPHRIVQLPLFPYTGHGLSANSDIKIVVGRDLSALAIAEFCCLAWFASLIGSFMSAILEMELASNQ